MIVFYVPFSRVLYIYIYISTVRKVFRVEINYAREEHVADTVDLIETPAELKANNCSLVCIHAEEKPGHVLCKQVDAKG